MKILIRKIHSFTTEFLWLIILWLIGGIVGGFGLFIVIGFTRRGFVYALLVTVLFLPFHISDYRHFFRQKNWIAIVGRSLSLYFIAAYVGGFVATMGGLMSISIDVFDQLILLACLLFSYFVLGFGLILYTFFKESRVYKYFQDIFDGMHLMGVLWRK